MYIHRAGRTARYRAGGKSLLMLTPDEEKKGFVELLQGKNASKIPLKKLKINPTKTVVVTERAASLVASDVKLQSLAKKAFQSYVRSIYLMSHKEIFDVKDLTLDAFSKSLGLASTPNLRFLKSAPKDRTELRETKNVNRKLQKLKEQIKAEKLAKKLKKMGKSEDEVKEELAKRSSKEEGADSDDEILVSKRRQSFGNDEVSNLPDVRIDEVSRSRQSKKIRIDGSNVTNTRIVFNEKGEAEDVGALKIHADAADHDTLKQKEELEHATDEYMQKVRERLQSNFEQDRAEEKARVRQKHKKRRLQEKAEKEAEGAIERMAVTLDNVGEDSSSDEEESSGNETVSSSTADSSGEEVDVKAQEDKALSLIRRGTT